MKYTLLGRSGLRISRLCLGCMSFGEGESGPHEWTLGQKESTRLIGEALEAGINFFDTANFYSAGTSEVITGRALRELAHRDEIVVATKAMAPWRNAPNTGGLSRKALFQAVDDSLMRLGMDYIDLYQVHRYDFETPVEEVMEALHDIVKSGKVRYIGASSMEAWRFAKMQYLADAHGWTRFISMQPQVNLVYREEEREMIPLCLDQGVGVIPWSPLARGMLTREPAEKTARSESDQFGQFLYGNTVEQDRKVVDAVGAVAAELGIPRAQVALAWLLQKPGITAPIVGVTKSRHIEDAVAALDVTLTEDHVRRLEAEYVPHEVTGVSFQLTFDGKVSVKKPG